MAAPRVEPAVEPEPPVREETPAAAALSQESTQAMAPVTAASAAVERGRRSVCPECYAPNPEGNAYCQECGSALPLTGTRQAAARPAAGQPAAARQPAYQQTAVLTPAAQTGAAEQPAYASPLPRVEKARGDKAFGVADIMALLAVGAGAISVALSYALDSFTWKKGLDIAVFAHQGAYTTGRTDLLGGPGLLPYEGAEFVTVGLVVAIGLALALVFLAVRVGRGPMFVLAGCLLLLPAAYLLFQAVLPLRGTGITPQSAVGINAIFFGNIANPGVGVTFWIITGAGVLLVVAGFIAPPRGWGRLFTFLICLGAVLGVAFFSAACFNWNLFISQSAAVASHAGPVLSRVLVNLPLVPM
jgi:ribosomal protein L40E